MSGCAYFSIFWEAWYVLEEKQAGLGIRVLNSWMCLSIAKPPVATAEPTKCRKWIHNMRIKIPYLSQVATRYLQIRFLHSNAFYKPCLNVLHNFTTILQTCEETECGKSASTWNIWILNFLALKSWCFGCFIAIYFLRHFSFKLGYPL